MGVFRIVFGLLCILKISLLLPQWRVWLTDFGPMPLADAVRYTGPGRLALWNSIPEGSRLQPLFLLGLLLASISLTLGLFTRVSSVLVFLGLASLHHRNPLILHSGDTLMRLQAFFLCLAPAGGALSLDRLWARRLPWRLGPFVSELAQAPLGMRLIQLQLCIVYLSTALWKLQGPMWRDGTALFYTSRLDEFQRLALPYVFDHLWSLRAFTYAALCTELLWPLLIWVPRFRVPMLLAGVGLHLGIELTMNVPLFQWIMLSNYILFWPESRPAR